LQQSLGWEGAVAACETPSSQLHSSRRRLSCAMTYYPGSSRSVVSLLQVIVSPN